MAFLQSVDRATRGSSLGRKLLAFFSNTWTLPYVYLVLALATVLLFCFIVPPLQVLDENRHFMRAVQFSQGNWISQMDVATNRAGGVLPAAVFQFVRRTMSTDFLQGEEALHTVRERINALDRASQPDAASSPMIFGAFPTATIYPPGLYLPQIIGIWIAKPFTGKVYVWFYSARICNAISAVLLIFLALRLVGPPRAVLLLFPAALPITLYQFSSVSSDASIISLSMLFVALCIRFLTVDTVLIRLGLILCLALLVMGKPVHLALGLLLLAAQKRVGWRRAISFCCLALGIASTGYLLWWGLVRNFMVLAGEGTGNPSAQMRFILTHPISMLKIMSASVYSGGLKISREAIGVLGWNEIPMPLWFLELSALAFGLIIILILVNYKKMSLLPLAFGTLSIIGLALAVFIAGYVLWNRPAAPVISLIQGRYFIPALPIIAFLAPPLPALGTWTRATLQTLCVGYLLFSVYTTVRVVDRCYFPPSPILGRNIHNLFLLAPSTSSCPASMEKHGDLWTWFAFTPAGRVQGNGDYRVLFAIEDGTILSESDPALTGTEFPYRLFPGLSHSQWRIHIWRPNKLAIGQLWLVRGGSACAFGPHFKFQPFTNSDPQALSWPQGSEVLLQ